MDGKEVDRKYCEEARPYRTVSLTNFLGSHLQTLWETGSWSDITISVKIGASTVKSLSLHRSVLSSSAFFTTRFRNEWRNARCGDLNLDGPYLAPDLVEATLRCLYGFELRITNTNVFHLLAAATFFELDTLQQECWAFINARLNGLSLQEVGEFYIESENLYDRCISQTKNVCLRHLAGLLPDAAAEDVIRLPEVVMRDLLNFPGLWFPDEQSRADFLVGLVECISRTAGGSPFSPVSDETVDGKVSSAPRKKAEFMFRILAKDVKFIFIPQAQVYQLYTRIHAIDPQLAMQLKTTIQEQLFQREVLYGSVLQAAHNSKCSEFGDTGQGPWFHFGVEFSGLEGMEPRQKVCSRKVYYAGSLWFVALIFEYPGVNSQVTPQEVCSWYGVHLFRRARVIGADAAFADERECVKVEFSLEVGKFDLRDEDAFDTHIGLGWPRVIHKSELPLFLTQTGVLRFRIGLRVVL